MGTVPQGKRYNLISVLLETNIGASREVWKIVAETDDIEVCEHFLHFREELGIPAVWNWDVYEQEKGYIKRITWQTIERK